MSRQNIVYLGAFCCIGLYVHEALHLLSKVFGKRTMLLHVKKSVAILMQSFWTCFLMLLKMSTSILRLEYQLSSI